MQTFRKSSSANYTTEFLDILHTNRPWVCVIKVCSNGGSTYTWVCVIGVCSSGYNNNVKYVIVL